MTPDSRVPLVLVSGLAPGPNAALAELLRTAELTVLERPCAALY